MRSTIRQGLQAQAVFTSAPMVIQETLIFPYVNGADFVRRFKAQRPGKLPFDSLPVSTEQLMHDAAYFGSPPDLPSEITLPAIPGTIDENDFGEFGTRLFVFQHTRDQDRSIRASNGWDGDRYALVKTPQGNALVWATVLLLGGSLLLLRAKDAMHRILALDVLVSIVVALLTVLSYQRDVSYYIDAALALALLSFTATVVVARYVTRGRPF